jgi:hypothetical protein
MPSTRSLALKPFCQGATPTEPFITKNSPTRFSLKHRLLEIPGPIRLMRRTLTRINPSGRTATRITPMDRLALADYAALIRPIDRA